MFQRTKHKKHEKCQKLPKHNGIKSEMIYDYKIYIYLKSKSNHVGKSRVNRE